jgi:hypothetical protein
MPINWSTWISGPDGTVDYVRVKSLVSILLALAAGLVMLAAAVLEVVSRVDIPTTHVLITGGAMLLPLTGGYMASMMGKGIGKAQADAASEPQ